MVSKLSVNQYSLERTYQSIEGLQAQGLFTRQCVSLNPAMRVPQGWKGYRPERPSGHPASQIDSSRHLGGGRCTALRQIDPLSGAIILLQPPSPVKRSDAMPDNRFPTRRSIIRSGPVFFAFMPRYSNGPTSQSVALKTKSLKLWLDI